MNRRLVVRNGYHPPRKVTTAAGTVEVKAPRVNDKRVDEATGKRKRFSSAILPSWCRKSPKFSEALPLLYLHGLSSRDFVPALEQFLGSSAGLSPATVTRLTQQWQAGHQAFGERDLSATDDVYIWADGIHLRIRLEQAKAAVMVVMGVRAGGTKVGPRSNRRTMGTWSFIRLRWPGCAIWSTAVRERCDAFERVLAAKFARWVDVDTYADWVIFVTSSAIISELLACGRPTRGLMSSWPWMGGRVTR